MSRYSSGRGSSQQFVVGCVSLAENLTQEGFNLTQDGPNLSLNQDGLNSPQSLWEVIDKVDEEANIERMGWDFHLGDSSPAVQNGSVLRLSNWRLMRDLNR